MNRLVINFVEYGDPEVFKNLLERIKTSGKPEYIANHLLDVTSIEVETD